MVGSRGSRTRKIDTVRLMLHSCDIKLRGSVDIEVTTSYRDYAQTVNWLMFLDCVFGPCFCVVLLVCVFVLCLLCYVYGLFFGAVCLTCVFILCLWLVF
jgi:hypothetical protein